MSGLFDWLVCTLYSNGLKQSTAKTQYNHKNVRMSLLARPMRISFDARPIPVKRKSKHTLVFLFTLRDKTRSRKSKLMEGSMRNGTYGSVLMHGPCGSACWRVSRRLHRDHFRLEIPFARQQSACLPQPTRRIALWGGGSWHSQSREICEENLQVRKSNLPMSARTVRRRYLIIVTDWLASANKKNK